MRQRPDNLDAGDRQKLAGGERDVELQSAGPELDVNGEQLSATDELKRPLNVTDAEGRLESVEPCGSLNEPAQREGSDRRDYVKGSTEFTVEPESESVKDNENLTPLSSVDQRVRDAGGMGLSAERKTESDRSTVAADGTQQPITDSEIHETRVHCQVRSSSESRLPCHVTVLRNRRHRPQLIR
jgi:hypothetical protein